MLGQKRYHRVSEKPGDSHFWARLMATKKFFFGHGSFLIRDGLEIRFWENKWLGNASLWEQYPALYAIVRHKSDTLAHVLGSNPPNVTFRRTLFEPRQVSWDALLLRLANIQLTTGIDIFWWNLHENGKFSVASLYNALILASLYNALILSDSPVYDNKKIWKMKIPLKNKNKLYGIYVEGLFLLKIILLSGIDMVVKLLFFVHKMR
jgi:hypothetical protein